jgi:cell division protein FtsL
MLELFDKYRRHPWLDQLRDPRVLGLVTFALIMVWMSWSGVNAIHTNYQLQQQIAQKKQENEIQQLKNENLKLQTEYYKTPQYLELAARQDYGLAMPGEKELLVSKDVAMAHVPAGIVDLTATSNGGSSEKRPFFVRNLQAWYDFFLHRTPSV